MVTMRELSEAELVREAVTGEVIDGIKATATVMVTIEYDVEETFEYGTSIEVMRDEWTEYIELPDGCMPKEWDYVEVEISKIEIDATKEEWYP